MEEFFSSLLSMQSFMFLNSMYLISRPQSMHSAYLMRRQSFAEQINRAHLSAKHALFIQFRCSSDVTFVKWLQRRTCYIALFIFDQHFIARDHNFNAFRATTSFNCGRQTRKINRRNYIQYVNLLTSFVETNHAISVLEAN